MSSKHSKMLQNSLKPIFKAEGFKKKAATWHQSTEDLFKFLNIQCSQNSQRIYINMGIYLHAVGKIEFPKVHQCHIRLRLESLLPTEKEVLEFYSISDFENETDEVSKIDSLTEIIERKAIPWLREFNTITDVASSGSITKPMYWNHAKEILENAANINT